MLSRKNQVKKKVFKVSIYPFPYELMVEAVDHITAKQEAINIIGIKIRDIYKITAGTQEERMLRDCHCANDRKATKKMIEEGYI